MSYIPSQAMPHAYVHDEDDTGETARTHRRGEAGPSAGVIIGGAIAGYLLYRLFR